MVTLLILQIDLLHYLSVYQVKSYQHESQDCSSSFSRHSNYSIKIISHRNSKS